MDKDILKQKIASLETKLDLLESEVANIDRMLVSCGFPEGIITLKEAMAELLSESDPSLSVVISKKIQE